MTSSISKILDLVDSYKEQHKQLIESHNRALDKEMYDIANIRLGSANTLENSINDLENILKEHQGEARSVSSQKDEKKISCKTCANEYKGLCIQSGCESYSFHRPKLIDSSDRSMRDES